MDGEGGIKAILHDELGFWPDLVEALKVCHQHSLQCGCTLSAGGCLAVGCWLKAVGYRL